MRIMQELHLEGEKPVLRIGGADLCNLLALSPAMLSELKRRGIAVHHGKDAYDLEATVRAYVQHLRATASGRGGEDHVSTLTTERARLAREQADAQALKNGALRGELVSAAEVERAWADELRRVRSRVLAVPSRVRQAVALDVQAADALDRELRSALMELGTDG